MISTPYTGPFLNPLATLGVVTIPAVITWLSECIIYVSLTLPNRATVKQRHHIMCVSSVPFHMVGLVGKQHEVAHVIVTLIAIIVVGYSANRDLGML